MSSGAPSAGLATATRQPLVQGHLSLPSLALTAAVVANAALAVLLPSVVWTLLALLLYALALQRMAAADARVLMMLMPFAILHLALMGSMLAIDTGAYMQEMGRSGHASPAGALYIVFALLFMVSAAWGWRRFKLPAATDALVPATSHQRLWPLQWVGCAIALGAAVYLLLAGWRTGYPLLTGADRLLFRASTADVLTLNLLNLKHTIAAAAGVGAVFATTRHARLSHHLAFGLFLVASFLYGDKFFIILISSGFYFMPFVLRRPQAIAATVHRALPVVALVVAAMGVVTYHIYSDYGQRSHADTLEHLAKRVAGQGQLWFSAVEDSSHALSFDVDEVAVNLGSITANPAAVYVFDQRIAAFHFIERYAPTPMYWSFMNNGGAVTPTMVLEAYGLVLFGYVGLTALLLLLGAGIGLLLNGLARAMLSGNPIRALLPAFAAAQSISVMSQATLYSVFSLSTFKAYAAFLTLQLLFGLVLSRLRGARS